jgi:hypothetical protein
MNAVIADNNSIHKEPEIRLSKRRLSAKQRLTELFCQLVYLFRGDIFGAISWSIEEFDSLGGLMTRLLTSARV